MNDLAAKSVILAVDDAPENLDVVKGVLGADYTIKAAINGMIALKIAEKAPPDLILLDIRMPGMDGYEVLARLKGSESMQSIPVVFLTGETDQQSESHALDMGAQGFVNKPIDAASLRGCVEQILSGSG